MIGTLGNAAITTTFVNPQATKELAAAAGGYIPNAKAMIRDSEAEMARRQRAIDRYYDRLAAKQARETAEIVVDTRPSTPRWIIPAILLAAVGLGAFFLFRRKK